MGLVPEGRPRWPRKGDPTNLVIPEGTPDDRRRHERRKADKRSRLIDRCWLGVLTVLWVWALLSVSAKQHQIDNLRIVGTAQRCELAHEIVRTLDDFGVPSKRSARIVGNYQRCLELIPPDVRKKVEHSEAVR